MYLDRRLDLSPVPPFSPFCLSKLIAYVNTCPAPSFLVASCPKLLPRDRYRPGRHLYSEMRVTRHTIHFKTLHIFTLMYTMR
jgi:hypothetical protein